MTRTYALLEVSRAAYDEIRGKLEKAGYQHSFDAHGTINMHGIGIMPETDTSAPYVSDDDCREAQDNTPSLGPFKP